MSTATPEWQGLNATPPNCLYHYTGFNAFKNILTSNEMWATFPRAGNDMNEFQLGINAFGETLHSILASTTDHSPMVLQLLSEFYGRITDAATRGFPVFVTCFSATDDNQHLWHEYAEQGQGYTIGFDFRDSYVQNALGEEIHLRFAEVIYGTQAMKEYAFSVLSPVISILQEIDTVAAWIEQKPEVLRRFQECVVCFKHETWAAEKEWRVTVHKPDGPWYLTTTQEKIDFWPQTTPGKPYVKLPIRGGPGGDSHLPITEVVLGKNNALHEEQVRQLLRDHGFDSNRIAVRRS